MRAQSGDSDSRHHRWHREPDGAGIHGVAGSAVPDRHQRPRGLQNSCWSVWILREVSRAGAGKRSGGAPATGVPQYPCLLTLLAVRSRELKQNSHYDGIQLAHGRGAGRDGAVAANGVHFLRRHGHRVVRRSGVFAIESQNHASFTIQFLQLSAVPGEYVAPVVESESRHCERPAIPVFQIAQVRTKTDTLSDLPAALTAAQAMADEDLLGMRLGSLTVPGNRQGMRRVGMVDQRGGLEHSLVEFDLV